MISISEWIDINHSKYSRNILNAGYADIQVLVTNAFYILRNPGLKSLICNARFNFSLSQNFKSYWNFFS